MQCATMFEDSFVYRWLYGFMGKIRLRTKVTFAVLKEALVEKQLSLVVLLRFYETREIQYIFQKILKTEPIVMKFYQWKSD